MHKLTSSLTGFCDFTNELTECCHIGDMRSRSVGCSWGRTYHNTLEAYQKLFVNNETSMDFPIASNYRVATLTMRTEETRQCCSCRPCPNYEEFSVNYPISAFIFSFVRLIAVRYIVR